MKHRLAGPGLLALLVFLAGACGGNEESTSSPAASDPATEADAALVQAAEKEGSVTWYSVFPPEAIQATEDAFEERYPDISVRTLRLTSGQLTTRYAEERASRAAPADLVSLSDSAFFDEADEKRWFEQQLELPALERWPDEFYGNGRATIGIVPLLLGHNTDEVAEGDVPSGWQDLLDPRWRGQMIYGDPRASPPYLALAELWRQEYGEEFLSRFATQDPTLVASIVPGSQQLAAGGAILIVPGANTIMSPLIDEGAPIAVTPVSPTTGSEFAAAISTDAPHPNAARLLMNFLLTEEGQAIVNSGGGTSVLGKVSDDTVPLPEGYRPVDSLLEDARENEERIFSLLDIEG